MAPNTLFYLHVGRFRYYDIILTSLFLGTYCCSRVNADQGRGTPKAI